jgi:hypothetical protein
MNNKRILIIKEIDLAAELKGETIVVETNHIEKVAAIKDAVQANNHLFCIKLHVNQTITSISWNEAWEHIPMVVYPQGLGAVRDFITLLPALKKLNVKFFLDAAQEQHYEAVQILSSLGIYCGMVISENADWERLTDLMYYALCGKATHAPIEPFQYIYDMYERNRLVDYGRVFLSTEALSAQSTQSWQRFFYEATPCAACPAWRICIGKYANLEDKTKCQNFMLELLQLVENLKFKSTPLIPRRRGRLFIVNC